MFDNLNLCDVHDRICALKKAGVKTVDQKAAYYGGCRGCNNSCSGGCGHDCSAYNSECIISI